MKKIKYRITGNGVAEKVSADLPVFNRRKAMTMDNATDTAIANIILWALPFVVIATWFYIR